MPGRIELDGLREFNRAVRKSTDRELPKRIGLANKSIGQLVISKLPSGAPQAVGTGAGAAIRPSATKREVLLRVGGAHRANRAAETGKKTKVFQWGRRAVPPFIRNSRPHIMGTVNDNRREIEKAYFKAIERALAGKGPMTS